MKLGITGHRPNRMHIGVARVEARLRAVLRALRRGCPDAKVARPIAISALAEGSDRLFAEAALGMGFSLHAILPFVSTDYETTFGDQADTPTYRTLLARACEVTVHPGTLADSTAAYEAAGRLTVDGCDILVTVWDGKAAAGRGGTPEIIQYALDIGRPVIWIDAARDRQPLLLRAPRAGGMHSVPVMRLAGRAKVMSSRQIIRLATGGRTSRAARRFGLAPR